jgi:hypothetical protein
MTDVAPTSAAGASDPANTNGSADAGLPGGPGEDAGLAAERERLARQLRDTRMQLAMTQTRLAALEQSASMRFGRAVANAAHRPWPRGVQLPRDLYRMWRERGVGSSGAQNAATALAAAQLTDLAGAGERFLSALTTPGMLGLSDPALTLAGPAGAAADASARNLVITGALSPLACATLVPDAVVHPLLPHDADVTIEGTGADLVLIEAAALLPGGPWAYATDPGAADRGRRLARMIVMARSLGKPVILLRNVPQQLMPGIGWLVSSCDAALDDDLGVQLARFNPLGVTPARPTGPVYAGDRDPREAPAVRGLLDQLTVGAGAPLRLTGARSWRALPALYREHSMFVTASASQAREQLACGARVIGPIGHGTGIEAVRADIDAAQAAGPRSLADCRAALRDIFTTHATPVRLAALARSAGLAAGLAGGRQIAVLASVADAAQADRLASELLRQRLRPAEVIVAADSADATASVRQALSGLADHGIRVVVTDAADAASPRELAKLADSPWTAPWPGDGQPDSYLLDLACARECAQADAVGFGAGEYEFSRWLDEPALARRGLLAAPDGPAASDWGSHGLRLFTVTR